jgi:arginyl-tRNA synthetase
MLTLFTDIQQAAAAAVKDHYGVSIDASSLAIQETRKDFAGDFTLVTFPLTRFKLGSPQQIGETLGALLLERLPFVAGFNVVQGFLNLSLTERYWLDFLTTYQDREDFFRRSSGAGQRVVVEYCSPNTNKPLHLGHLRNITLGYALSQILKANGFEVSEVCLFNDRGTAICKSMYAWQLAGKEDTPASTGLKGDQLVGDYYVQYARQLEGEVADLVAQGMDAEAAGKSAPSTLAINEMLIQWEAEDPAIRSLWERMNSWVYEAYAQTFARLDVHFDRFYYESDLYQLGKQSVMRGLESGAFYQKEDGSVWVDLTEEGLDHKLLIRSNGTSVYITQDISTAEARYEDYHMDRCVYVVGNEQEYHFKVLFLIMKKLGFAFADGLYHLSYGMVDLPSGKMKSREGTTVDADDLIDQVVMTARAATEELGKTEGMAEAELTQLYERLGLAALKFFLLKVDPKKRMLFDPAESVDLHGHTGPFVQYASTNTAAISRKGESVAAFESGMQPEDALHENEIALLKRIFRYQEVLHEAAAGHNPALIANYAYELAKEYNRFYHGDKILKPDSPQTSSFRFALSAFAGKTLLEAMTLLGIEMPERM